MRRTFLIATFVAAALSLTASAVRADQIDQEYPETYQNNWYGISYGLWNGQSFTPSLNYLTGADFFGLPASHAWNSLPDGTAITMQIWTTSGGLPATLLDSVTRTTPLGEANWNGPFTLASPLDVSAHVGNPFSLFAAWTVPNNVGGEETTAWGNAASGPGYANGAFLQSTNQGASWSFTPFGVGADMMFRTYGEVPEPTALGSLLVAGAIAMCQRRRVSRA